MVDTHCHLYDEAFDTDRDQAVERAVTAGVDTLLLPAIDSNSHSRQEALASVYPDVFFQMMGLHPTSVDDDFEKELAIVQQKLFAVDSPVRYVAVGEIGLDLYWDRTYFEQQREVLRRQMEWASQLSLPVCLHVRKAYNELFGLLRDLNQRRYFHIGIGGVVTFKNATLAQVAAAVPLESILLETDAPYLAPVPYRGKRNESAYIPVIAQKIAEIRGVSVDEVAQVTTQSAQVLFGL